MKNTTDIKLSWTKDPLEGTIHEEWVTPEPIKDVLDVLGTRRCTVFCDGLETTDFDQTPKESLHIELQVETSVVVGFIVSALVGYASYRYMRSKFEENDIASPEEIESLRAQRNRDRRFDPLPIILGEKRVIPALAAQPYTESSGRDQWLNILLAPGHIPIKISDIQIGETAIDQFGDDVQLQVYDGWDNTNPIILFPFDIFEDQVDFEFPIEREVVGTEQKFVGLDPNGSPIYEDVNIYGGAQQQEIQTTAANADEIEVTFHYPQGLFRRSRSSGDIKKIEHNLRIDYREVGTTEWIRHTSRRTERADTKAFRLTERWSVPRGQYEVRVIFQPWRPEDNRNQTFIWESLKTIRDETPINTSLSALIALRIKATNRNSGNLDRVSCLCTSMVPDSWEQDWSDFRPENDEVSDFNPNFPFAGFRLFPKNIWFTETTNYSDVAMKESRNPAELFRWVLQGPFLKVLIDDNKIDKENLNYFRTFTSFREFECNAEVKSEKTVSELLNAIASTSLGELIVKNGKYAISIDEEKDSYSGIFTFKNSADLSFSREFLEPIDGFRVDFKNRDLNFERDEILVGLDTVEAPTGNFERVRLWGTTKYDQAYEIARHKLAERQLRQEGYNFTANAESVDCTKGDLILVQIPTIGIGAASGRISSVSGTTITVDEFCDPARGDSVQIIDNLNNTSIFSVVSNIDGFELELDSTPGDVKDLRFVYGNAEEEARECIIDEIKPNNDLTFEITAFNYAPEIFTIDAGEIPEYSPIDNLPEDRVPEITITDFRVQRTRSQTDSGESKVEVNIVYSYPSQFNTSTFDVELQYRRVGENGFTAVRQSSQVGEFDLSGFVDRRTYEFRIRGIRGSDVGEFTTFFRELKSDPLEDPFLPRVNGLSLYETTGNVFTGRDVKIVWRPTSTTRRYELGQEPSGGDDGSYDDFFKDYRVTVFDTETNEELRDEYVKDPEFVYSYENNVQDGGPRRKLRFAVQLRGNNNQLGEKRKITVENETPPLHTGFSINARFSSIVFEWNENDALDFLKTKIWVETDSGFDPEEREPKFNGPGTGAIVDGLVPNTDYFIRYQTFDTFGPGPVSGEFAVTTLTATNVLNLGAWAEVDLGTREQIEDWLTGEPTDFEFIPRIAAGQIVSGVLQATELVESEGLIRVVDDISNPSFETILGPNFIDTTGDNEPDTLYLLHAKDVGSTNVTFGIGENGNFLFNGNPSNFIEWNGNTLNIRGDLNADDIAAGTITGRTLQTDSSGERFEVNASDNFAKFFNSNNEDIIRIGPGSETVIDKNGNEVEINWGIVAGGYDNPTPPLPEGGITVVSTRWGIQGGVKNAAQTDSSAVRAFGAETGNPVLFEGFNRKDNSVLIKQNFNASTLYTTNFPENLDSLTSGFSVAFRRSLGLTVFCKPYFWNAIIHEWEPIHVASAAEGSVGTYVFAYDVDETDTSFGSTRPGSNLRPTSVDAGSDGDFLDGTWRCMGTTNSDGGADGGTTLWLRIS